MTSMSKWGAICRLRAPDDSGIWQVRGSRTILEPRVDRLCSYEHDYVQPQAGYFT
jgi:hypothetical protein